MITALDLNPENKGQPTNFFAKPIYTEVTVTELREALLENFGQLPEEDLEKLLSFFQLEKISKNGYFTEENKYCRRLSFQKSGILRVCRLSDGKEITQWISTPQYFITDISSFFFDQPSRWTIQALTDVELLTINKENYSKVCKEFPKWNEIEKRFIAKCFGILENRVYSHLAMTAEERYDLFFEQNKELFNQVPLQYLASALGMRAETFSRIRMRKAKTS